jgi:hypothetical protein
MYTEKRKTIRTAHIGNVKVQMDSIEDGYEVGVFVGDSHFGERAGLLETREQAEACFSNAINQAGMTHIMSMFKM